MTEQQDSNEPEAVAQQIVQSAANADDSAPETEQQALEARENAFLEQADPGRAEDGDEPAAEPAAPEQPVDDGALADAYTVLRRDGFQREDLESLDSDKILRLAEHRKKVQTDVDRLIREGKERRQNEETEADEQTLEDSGEAQTQAEATPDAPLTANLQDAAAPLAEYLGLDDEGKDLLVKSYEAVVSPVLAQVQHMQTAMLQKEIEQARAELAGVYPQVADGEDDNMERVLGRMVHLYDAQADNPPSTRDLMEEAIALEFRADLRKEAQSANETKRRYQRNGMPDAPKRQRTPEREMSMEEREAAVLDLLESDIPDRMQRARDLGGR